MKNMPNPLNIFLTEVYSRNPTFKLHSALSHAKNAIAWGDYRQARAGKIYQLVDSEWEVLYDVPMHTLKEHLPWR